MIYDYARKEKNNDNMKIPSLISVNLQSIYYLIHFQGR